MLIYLAAVSIYRHTMANPVLAFMLPLIPFIGKSFYTNKRPITFWSLLSNTDFTRGPYGHATLLSPTRGGHKTPFIAVLINTAHDAPTELSDLPGRRFVYRHIMANPVLETYAPTDPSFWECLLPYQ